MKKASTRRRGGALAAAAVAALMSTEPAAAQAAAAAEAGDAQQVAAPATGPADAAVFRQAQAFRGTKITVSTNERRLRLVAGNDTLMDVAVAIGMNDGFQFEDREFFFRTPTGRRTVRLKEENPVWTPPDWHYMEKAAARGLELVRLQRGDTVRLSDDTFITIIGDQVGRINQFGNFWPFTPGIEIVFDERIFMPPFGTAQRRVPDALGPYKLDLGDGYLIHGTHIYNEDSIGQAVSHGCVRMNNDDLERLYTLVRTGVPVFIY
jgi:lipoprotein-anchoring transpeptidase ErfK/SrfK